MSDAVFVSFANVPTTFSKKFAVELLQSVFKTRRIAVTGYIGERAKDEYLVVVKEALEKDGAEVIIKEGDPGTKVFESTYKYIAKYDANRNGIEIFYKETGKKAGQIDGLIFVNGKPVVIEAKASQAETIAKDFSNMDNFFDKKIKMVEDLTGQTPEVLLLIPKGEAAENIGGWWIFKKTLADEIDSLGTYLKNKGVNFAYDEFHVTRDGFERVARRLKDQAISGGG